MFRESLSRVAARNAAHKTEVFGINKFSDLSREEFRTRYLSGYKPDPALSEKFIAGAAAASVQAGERKSAESLPPVVDWREAGVVTQVNDQGQCGASGTTHTGSTDKREH